MLARPMVGAPPTRIYKGVLFREWAWRSHRGKGH